MTIEIKVPVIGESVTEVTLVAWHKEDGELVEEGDIICDIESDKATIELPAETAGILKRTVKEGSDLPIGAVIATLQASAATPPSIPRAETISISSAEGSIIEIKVPVIGESVTEVSLTVWHKESGDAVEEGDIICEIESDKATIELPAESSGIITQMVEEGADLPIGAIIANLAVTRTDATQTPTPPKISSASGHPSPAAGKILAEKRILPETITGSGKGGRITKGDALSASIPEVPKASTGFSRNINKEKMSRLRKTIATRLTEAKNSTAMLTTFNEVDMKPVMDLRAKYQDEFVKAHGIKLGFMSLFTKACCIAMKKHPLVNAQINGDTLLIAEYVDMGIAVSAPKGLVVPVVKNAESMNLAQIESEIKRLATKARDGKLTVDEMSGGTFTITNGGVFGSMLSTPILNIPQSGILGMHNIVERPWVVNGEIKIRPIMYIALSYDHRVIDGKDSVGFLKTVKELLEDPAKMILDI